MLSRFVGGVVQVCVTGSNVDDSTVVVVISGSDQAGTDFVCQADTAAGEQSPVDFELNGIRTIPRPTRTNAKAASERCFRVTTRESAW